MKLIFYINKNKSVNPQKPQKMEMLAHQKIILQNVCFDKELFKNELYKCLEWLEKEEIEELAEWLKSNYWSTNNKEIIAVFKTYMILDTDTFHNQ